MQCNIKLITVASPLRWKALILDPPLAVRRSVERCLGLRRCSSGIHVIGDYVMDSNNRIGRRERFEILKIVQGLGDGSGR